MGYLDVDEMPFKDSLIFWHFRFETPKVANEVCCYLIELLVNESHVGGFGTVSQDQ
jgi:hypothetical protein